MMFRKNFWIILILPLLAITYSEAACTCSDKTVTKSNGVVDGACMTEARGGKGRGKLFTYVKIDENPEECCEANTASFRTYCINYSQCDCQKNPETCCSKQKEPATNQEPSPNTYNGYNLVDLLKKPVLVSKSILSCCLEWFWLDSQTISPMTTKTRT